MKLDTRTDEELTTMLAYERTIYSHSTSQDRVARAGRKIERLEAERLRRMAHHLEGER